MRQYLTGRMNTGAQEKIRNISQAWLWHDDDELLMYEGLLEDYHQR